MPVTFRPKTTKIAQRAQRDPLLYEILRDLGNGLIDLWRAILALFAERVSGTTGQIAKFIAPDAVGDSVVTETSRRIGINEESPAAALHVVNPGIASTFILERYGGAPFFEGRRANGTVVLPTTVLSGQNLTAITTNAHDGTAFSSNAGGVTVVAAETWSNVAHGTRVVVATTPSGTTTVAAALIVEDSADVRFAGGFKGSRQKDLTEGAATGFADISVASGETLAGECIYAVEASDGTDHQVRSGRLRFVAVNKAGTVTASINEVGTQEIAVSAGTLTVTSTVTAGANKITLESNATSSLVQTVLRVRYRVDVLSTTAAITPL